MSAKPSAQKAAPITSLVLSEQPKHGNKKLQFMASGRQILT